MGDGSGVASVLDGLNDAQREAATHTGGPLIVLAGPGTGKTRLIVSRIGYLVRELGADPSGVLALTFTNKAAGELRERLAEMLGPSGAEAVGAYTFNGFGAHLLRRFSDLAGLPPEPELIDSAQRVRLMRRIVGERGLFREALATGLDSAIENATAMIRAMHCAALTAETARARIDAREEERKTTTRSPEESLAESALIARMRDVVSLWEGFDAACLEGGLISFDDQVSRTNRLLARSETARAFVRADYRHIVVDEYQDVNAAQIEMLRLVAPPGEMPDLCVVGDDDQSIYGFRGSDDRAFERFERTWQGVRTITLEENYRSATPVLTLAASVIGKAHDRFRAGKVVRRAGLLGDDPEGSAVEAVRLENFRQAGEVIATMIARSVREHPGTPLNGFAVIARSWNDLDMIRGALEVEGIPTRLARARAPAEDDGVLDVLAWIELLIDPSRSWSARRILRRPPNQLGVEGVAELESRYLGLRGGGGPFPVWAAGEGARAINAGTGDRAVLDRFASVWSSLREMASTASASAVIGEIIRRTDVVHAELLDGRQRARRVAAVVAMLRFAAERAGRLEEPGDLRAFMAYREDLDKKDRTLTPDRMTHEEVEGDDPGEEGEGVSLLTAHGAKGLEFDTVFLPRVESKDGYPSKRKPAEETTPPDWLTGDDLGTRTRLESIEDEERRLFYVACTRAQRRLVLLGKVPKSSKAMNFMIEILGEGDLAVEREAAEVLGPHAGNGVDHEPRVLGWDASARRREALRSARRVARLEGASALDAADRPGLDEADLASAVGRLEGAARRLAAVARAEAGAELPGWLLDDETGPLHAALRSPGDEAPAWVSAAEAVMRPMSAPLSLSYTALNDWLKCPRCSYMKYVLKLPEDEGVPIVVGSVVHTALERFYQRVKESGERGVPEPGLGVLISLGVEAIERERARGRPVDDDQVDRVRALLETCHERLHDATINVADVEKKITFTYEHNGRHAITAKIDRLDVSEAGFRIVDYKTGRATKTLLEPKHDDLQMGIYALALRASINGGEFDGFDPPGGTAEYWVLSTGERGVIGLDRLAESEQKTRAKIEEAIDGMLEGRYERGKDCWGACGFFEPGGMLTDP